MQKTEPNILKSSQVKIEGQFHLDAGPTPSQRQANPTLAAPRVRILENHQEYAVLEVTCTCGNKAHVKCQYDVPQSTANKPQ